MNKLLLLALAGATSVGFMASPAMAQTRDTAAYKQATSKAADDYKMTKAKCDEQSGNAKDLCVQEAKAARARADADAVAQFKNDTKDVRKSRIAVADADYDVAKAKCADMGDSKGNCLREAKVTHTAAVNDAKAEQRAATTAQANADCDRLSGSDKAACVARGKSASAGEAVADTVITTKVKADLIKEPDLKAMDVHVETVNGVVMLSGFVPSQAEADKAVQLARGVKGVTEVQNGLQIKK
ncbi:MAG: BON domain-containing protein [Pseudomonadota bacterium]